MVYGGNIFVNGGGQQGPRWKCKMCLPRETRVTEESVRIASRWQAGCFENDADASGVERMVGQASRSVETIEKNHLSRPESRDVSFVDAGARSRSGADDDGGEGPLNVPKRPHWPPDMYDLTCHFGHVTFWKI